MILTLATIMLLAAAPEPKAAIKPTPPVATAESKVKGKIMIIDRIENAAQYRKLGKGIALALDSLKTKREPGRHELDGDKVFALVQRYQTKPQVEGKWESHRKFIDVQYVEEGVERIGWAPINKLTVTEPYDESKDIVFHKGDGEFVTVPAGFFVIFFPEDGHMPGLAVDQPSPVKKVVVKIRR
jgi:YhcH/YjgK/YiaL family protein